MILHLLLTPVNALDRGHTLLVCLSQHFDLALDLICSALFPVIRFPGHVVFWGDGGGVGVRGWRYENK